MLQETRAFKCRWGPSQSMTKARVATLLVLLMLLPALPAGARSVHSTADVDLLPQGVFNDATAWDLDDSVSFSTAPAQHTQAMVADDHLTFMHERPENLVAQTVWATATPTDSNASLGAPDGAYTWSTGPDIDVNGFDVSGLTNYAVRDVTLLLAIEVPGALYQDKVRISHETGGVFDLVKTWSNTGGGIDYMDGQPYRIGLDDPTNWSWSELADLTVRLDYVSEGTTDDSELRVDAVGLEIVVLTPWYGGEQATATTTTTDVEVPVLHLDMAAGTTDGLSLAACGLQATSEGTMGHWTSALVERPAEQRLGRVAYAFEGPTDNLSFEMRTVAADGSVGDWTSYDTGTLLPDVDAVHLRVSMNEGCMTRLTVDVNDPTLTLNGRIHGDVEGLLESSSRWAPTSTAWSSPTSRSPPSVPSSSTSRSVTPWPKPRTTSRSGSVRSSRGTQTVPPAASRWNSVRFASAAATASSTTKTPSARTWATSI